MSAILATYRVDVVHAYLDANGEPSVKIFRNMFTDFQLAQSEISRVLAWSPPALSVSLVDLYGGRVERIA